MPRSQTGPHHRDRAVRIAKDTGRPVAHVAREFGVNEGALGALRIIRETGSALRGVGASRAG